MIGICFCKARRFVMQNHGFACKWPHFFFPLFPVVCTVIGLEEGKECIIVGTLYKHMKLKPSILEEYSKEVMKLLMDDILIICFFFCLIVTFIFANSYGLFFWDINDVTCVFQRSATPLVRPHNFMHPDDHLILEDESGRIKVCGDVLLPSVYVTGLYLMLLWHFLVLAVKNLVFFSYQISPLLL